MSPEVCGFFFFFFLAMAFSLSFLGQMTEIPGGS